MPVVQAGRGQAVGHLPSRFIWRRTTREPIRQLAGYPSVAIVQRSPLLTLPPPTLLDTGAAGRERDADGLLKVIQRRRANGGDDQCRDAGEDEAAHCGSSLSGLRLK